MADDSSDRNLVRSDNAEARPARSPTEFEASIDFRIGRRAGGLAARPAGASLEHLIELMGELEAERIGFRSVTKSIDD